MQPRGKLEEPKRPKSRKRRRIKKFLTSAASVVQINSPCSIGFFKVILGGKVWPGTWVSRRVPSTRCAPVCPPCCLITPFFSQTAPVVLQQTSLHIRVLNPDVSSLFKRQIGWFFSHQLTSSSQKFVFESICSTAQHHDSQLRPESQTWTPPGLWIPLAGPCLSHTDGGFSNNWRRENRKKTTGIRIRCKEAKQLKLGSTIVLETLN